jgi:hypothetical protein
MRNIQKKLKVINNVVKLFITFLFKKTEKSYIKNNKYINFVF